MESQPDLGSVLDLTDAELEALTQNFVAEYAEKFIEPLPPQEKAAFLKVNKKGFVGDANYVSTLMVYSGLFEESERVQTTLNLADIKQEIIDVFKNIVSYKDYVESVLTKFFPNLDVTTRTGLKTYLLGNPLIEALDKLVADIKKYEHRITEESSFDNLKAVLEEVCKIVKKFVDFKGSSDSKFI